jgi:hypothetical protein
MSTGFTVSAAVCPADQATVLAAIVAKLRTDLSDLFGNDSTCFVSDIPWPSIEVQDELFCTVCPGTARFDPDRPVGAADLGIVEVGVFQVSVWSKLALDRLEQCAIAMTHADRGLLRLKQLVLRSLAGQQIYADAPVNTVPLLIQYLRPTQAMHPAGRQGGADYSSFTLLFEAPFYWDLT